MSEVQTNTPGVVMTAPTEKELALAFPKMSHGGYIYIILFESGILKAGRTQKPAQRISNHASNAAAFSTSISQVWVSCPHDNFASNEAELMASVAAMATKQNNREFFEGIDFSDAVALAEQLVFAPIDFEAHEARDQARFQKMKRFLGMPDPEPEPENPARAWGAPILKMFAQLREVPELEEQQTEATRDAWDLAAAAMGLPVEEVMEWSYLEVMEHVAKLFVRTAYLDTKIWAMKNGRPDLTAPMSERFVS